MKNLISKKLALLAIVLFASIGHAFGANATVSITDDKGASVGSVVDLSFSGEDYAWTQWDDIIEIPTGEDVWMNAYLVKSQYETLLPDYYGVQNSLFYSTRYQIHVYLAGLYTYLRPNNNASHIASNIYSFLLLLVLKQHIHWAFHPQREFYLRDEQ